MAENKDGSGPEARVEGLELIRVVLNRVGLHSYEGGVNGTCYECPFGSAPLTHNGYEARWDDVSNDPTEAYFRCSLPGRDNQAIVWGEYAPCTEREWATAALDALTTETAPAVDS